MLSVKLCAITTSTKQKTLDSICFTGLLDVVHFITFIFVK